jgi:AraC-like DNA-binding protein
MAFHGAEQRLQVTARFLRPLLSELEARGLAVHDLCLESGIEPAGLSHPDAHLPLSCAAALFELSVAKSGDRLLPVRATLQYRPDPNLFDYASMASATLGDALVRVSRYSALMIEGIELSLERGPVVSRMCYRSRHALSLPDCMIEYIVGVGVIASQHWLRLKFPVTVELRHHAPEIVDGYLGVFGEVRFDCADNAVCFPTAALELPLPEADPEMSPLLDARASAKLQQKRATTPSLKARVRDALLVQLEDGEPSLERIAERLKMSARTLRRRLREEDTTHRELLDGLRQELARAWLAEPGAQIEDVALRLGFSDATSFHRAFRRWEGKTPAQFIRER